MMTMQEKIENFSKQYSKVRKEIAKDMVGQEDVIEGTLIAMIAGGNVLLEGVPGVGKTRLVRSIGRAMNLSFSRIQFTPDMMPADVTGTNIVEKDEKGVMHQRFAAGPIFSNIVLADEINRTTPKTQSALLEAMQEHRVTAGGVTRQLSEPFFVLATQNPIEQDGTYPLPEAQMDRFMFKLLMRFPGEAELENIVQLTMNSMEEVAQPVLSGTELLEMREAAMEIPVLEEVMQYAIRLVTATHPELPDSPAVTKNALRFGASPRAAQALVTAARIRALIQGRYNVAYDDIRALACPVLRHRVKLSYEAVMSKQVPDQVIWEIIQEMEASMMGRNRMPKRAFRFSAS